MNATATNDSRSAGKAAGINWPLVALAVGALAVLLVPVYLWLLHRDAMLAPQRAAELAKIEALLAETETRAA